MNFFSGEQRRNLNPYAATAADISQMNLGLKRFLADGIGIQESNVITQALRTYIRKVAAGTEKKADTDLMKQALTLYIKGEEGRGIDDKAINGMIAKIKVFSKENAELIKKCIPSEALSRSSF